MAVKKEEVEETKKTYKVTLPLTSEKMDDVTVIINGFVTKIQRGVEVEVSEPVYEVLKNSERMDNLALRRRMELAARSNM